jgi:ectoine hydroxylase-related dioxygenase (phytanoyl-CoA dioxygenase family)
MTQRRENQRPLSDSNLQHHCLKLCDNGFTIVKNVLTEAELTFLRPAIDDIYATYDPQRDGLRRVDGYRFASNLVNFGAFFESIFLRSPVYDLVRNLLGDDCILSSLNSLEPLPGQGNQVLHRDQPSESGSPPIVANSLWAIDEMDRANGATRLIPASHKNSDPPPADESGAVYAEVEAGSVIVTNAHILHGASANRSGRRRRVMHGYFTKNGYPQQLEQRKYLSDEVKARLSPLARRVLAIDDDEC